MKVYGEHPVSTDGDTWYPQACQFLKLDQHIHSSLEKSLIERTIQYIKDRAESFDNYFLVEKKTASENLSSSGLRRLLGIITTTLEINFTEPAIEEFFL